MQDTNDPGRRPRRDCAGGFVTIGDIVKRLADACAVPWEGEARE